MQGRWVGSTFALVALGMFFGLAPRALAQDGGALAIHGFNDLTYKNDYITPRGLLVTNKGSTIQVVNGLVLNTYHSAEGALNDVSLVGGIFNDLNPGFQRNPSVGYWNEFDWFGGVQFSLYKDWSAGIQYVAFISPPGNFKAEHNIEFNLGYDDGGRWFSPITLKPYVKLFFTASGDSTVVLGKVPSFDVELGAIPTWDLHPYEIPITLTMPTWVTVGPSNFWGGTDNVGVFSTGINARWPIEWVPPRYGQWSFNAGIQYYNLINSQLRNAQGVIGVVPPGSNGYRNVVVFAAGFGFHF